MEAVTARNVCDVLRRLSYGRSLDGHPLLEIASVEVRLREEGVARTKACRAWALGCVLHDVAGRELARLCRTDEVTPVAEMTAEAERAMLRQAFESGSGDSQALCLVFCRHLGVSRIQNNEAAALIGASLRTVTRRMQRGYEVLAGALRSHERLAARQRLTMPGAPVLERIVVDEVAPGRSGHEARAALLDTVHDDGLVLCLAPAQVDAVVRLPASDLSEYWLGRLAEWSRPRYRLDERFVTLTLLTDQGEDAAGGRWEPADQRYSDLRDVLDAVDATGIVLLGAPGSGKSTLLRHLEMQLAVAGLQRGGGPLTFFVQLGQYSSASGRESPPDPLRWLCDRWAARYPRLPPLAGLLAEGRVILLLDGLNEMPRRSEAEYRDLVVVWKHFLLELAQTGAGSRVVFSCRSLDYSQPLSTPSLRVPQVRIEPLSDDQVREFLARYEPARAHALWRELAGTPQLEVLRAPFFLRLLAEPESGPGALPHGRAALFTACIRHALAREVMRDNVLFRPELLLTARDCRRLVHARKWRDAYELPEEGPLFRKAGELAFAMQHTSAGRDQAHVRLVYRDAVAVVDHGRAADLLQALYELGLAEEDADRDEVMFSHQLVQEFFAARVVAARPNPDLARVSWREGDVTPSVAELAHQLRPADRLPDAPRCGWEETIQMAAAMSRSPEAFVGELMPANLALAGQCAGQPEVRDRLRPTFVDTLRHALAERSCSPAADLRHRIACGLALGRLGDPRFERGEGCEGAYLRPPMVVVKGGFYPIGEDLPLVKEEGREWDDHCPAHRVRLRPFAIGRFHVTNAEYACFMDAGGYDDERWWEGAEARAWREGRGTGEAARQGVRETIARMRDREGVLTERFRAGSWELELYALWKGRIRLSPAQLEERIYAEHPDVRITEPRFWRDERFNNPLQPVIGICWFEARAYCRWLATATGIPFRLLTEVEREAAARGEAGHLFPYGNEYAPLWSCGIDVRVGRTVPVGVFPLGDSPAGVSDMSGNTKTWTSTAWGTDPFEPTYRYPYVPDDGREEADTDAAVRRIVRGASFRCMSVRARATCRGRSLPGYRTRYTGLRLCADVDDEGIGRAARMR